jgi:hypothetical protein
MTLPNFPVEGGCLCGDARYRLTAPPLGVYACHCKDCQRSSGSTNSMAMAMPREHVQLLQGELTSYDKRADSGRTVRTRACSRCGITLWTEPLSAPKMLMVKAGTLDDMSWAAPIGNIWTASRPAWVKIDESLVNFPGQPVDRQPLFDAWTRTIADH